MGKNLPQCLTMPVAYVEAEGGSSKWVEVIAFLPTRVGVTKLKRGWMRRNDYEIALYLGWRFVALGETDELP